MTANHLLQDDHVQCQDCKQMGVDFYTKQLRSADEGQTIFYECPECGCVTSLIHTVLKEHGAKSCTAPLCQAELLVAPKTTAAGLLPCQVTGEHDTQLTSCLFHSRTAYSTIHVLLQLLLLNGLIRIFSLLQQRIYDLHQLCYAGINGKRIPRRPRGVLF